MGSDFCAWRSVAHVSGDPLRPQTGRLPRTRRHVLYFLRRLRERVHPLHLAQSGRDLLGDGALRCPARGGAERRHGRQIGVMQHVGHREARGWVYGKCSLKEVSGDWGECDVALVGRPEQVQATREELAKVPVPARWLANGRHASQENERDHADGPGVAPRPVVGATATHLGRHVGPGAARRLEGMAIFVARAHDRGEAKVRHLKSAVEREKEVVGLGGRGGKRVRGRSRRRAAAVAAACVP